MKKVVPSPTTDLASRRPPWFLTIEYEVASPSPLPFAFVVK